MDDLDLKPEPPAGIIFSNVIPMQMFTEIKSRGGYEIIETAPAQETYTRYKKHKRTQLHKSASSMAFGSAMSERRLRIMANSGYTDELRQFLETTQDVKKIINKSDSKNRTALHFAASRGSDEIVQMLLQYGANPNLQDFNGNTALHLAACTHHIRVVTLLLRYGANVNTTDSFGKTPLHLSLSRLKRLQLNDKNNYSTERRKIEVSEIVAMLKEYFEKSGQKEHQVKMIEITQQLSSVKTDQEVQEVNSLLATFTQMTIDAEAKSKMSEE